MPLDLFGHFSPLRGDALEGGPGFPIGRPLCLSVGLDRLRAILLRSRHRLLPDMLRSENKPLGQRRGSDLDIDFPSVTRDYAG